MYVANIEQKIHMLFVTLHVDHVYWNSCQATAFRYVPVTIQPFLFCVTMRWILAHFQRACGGDDDFYLGLRPAGSPQAVILHAFSVRVHQNYPLPTSSCPLPIANWENKAESLPRPPLSRWASGWKGRRFLSQVVLCG